MGEKTRLFSSIAGCFNMLCVQKRMLQFQNTQTEKKLSAKLKSFKFGVHISRSKQRQINQQNETAAHPTIAAFWNNNNV